MGDTSEGQEEPLIPLEPEEDPKHVAHEHIEAEPGETRKQSIERQAITHAAAAATTIGPDQVARFSFKRFHNVYRIHMPHNPRRERLFLGSLGFFVAIVGVRLLTLAIKNGVGPIHNVSAGGTHIHHLVWGILLLIVVGYLWMVEIGTRDNKSNWMSRLTSIAFGVGVALTLDEFALWLNLQDVYWQEKGQESFQAIFAFIALLSLGFWGAALLRGLVREVNAMARGVHVAEHLAAMELHTAENLAETEMHAAEHIADRELQHMRRHDPPATEPPSTATPRPRTP
jgi:hypothetical protein